MKNNSSIFVVVILMTIITTSFVVSITSQSQINSLHPLYNHTNGKNWKWKNETDYGSIWSFNSQSQKDPCNTNSKSWQGINCSSTSTTCQNTTCNIIEINLQVYGLKGNIPEALFTLTSLTSLLLSSNRIVGTIPSSLGLLTQLQHFSLLKFFNNLFNLILIILILQR